MILCGIILFSAFGKHLDSFPSHDSCSGMALRPLISACFISACILIRPGVMISPGRLLDVAKDILTKVLK